MVEKITAPNGTVERAPYGTLSAWFYLLITINLLGYINFSVDISRDADSF